MPSKDERIASDLARHLLRVRRLRGVPLWQAGQLWLLSRPASRPADPAGLAAALLAQELPPRQQLALLIGAQEVIPVSSGTAGKAAFHLKQLQSSRRLSKLVAQGERPLRGYRRLDLEALLLRIEQSVEQLLSCQQAAAQGEVPRRALCDAAELPAAEELRLPRGPRQALRRLLPLAHRLPLLYDEALTGRTLEDLLEPWRGQTTRSELSRRLGRFAQLVADHARDRAAADDEVDAALLRSLKRIPRLLAPATRRLVELFLAWVRRRGALQGHLPPRRRLMRCAGIALGRGGELSTAATALVEEVAGAAPEQPAPPAAAVTEATLALHLTHPRLSIRSPGGPVRALAALRGAWQLVADDDAATLWPALAGCEPKVLERCAEELLRGEVVPAPVVARMLRLGLVQRTDLWEAPQRLPPYLDAVELVRRCAPEIEAGARWFRALFLGPSWGPALALALLTRADHGGGEQPLVLLNALAQTLPRERALEQALASWHKARVESAPPELSALAAALDLSREQLVLYLHHRRLAGYGERFSAKLLEVLAAPQAGRARAARRGRRRLERALTLLRRESLRAVLQQALRATLSRLVGALPQGPLPEGLFGALKLLHAPQIDHALLVGFLRDVIDGRSLSDRTDNQRWLRRASEAGLDTDRWLAGLHEELLHEGERLTLDTEHDALHALQMGSYFDTCLGLAEGENAASTLLNALDINKQVIYLRRADGAVIGRKLIGASADGSLGGYRTYLSGGMARNRELHTLVNRVIARYSVTCGLRLEARTTPERLHDGFWYDDGNEPWPNTAREAGPPPDLPGDRAAMWEWTFTRGFDGEPSVGAPHLEELAAIGSYSWRSAATFWRTLRPGVGDPPPAGWCEASLLRLWGDGPARPQVEEEQQRGPYDQLCDALEALAPRSAAVTRVAALASTLARGSGGREPGYSSHDGLVAPPGSAALGDPGELLALCGDFLRLAERPCRECLEEHPDCMSTWRATWAELLVVASLRCDRGEALGRALDHRDPRLRAIAVRACQAVRLPELSGPLRKALRAAEGDEHVELALALGMQGQERDRWRLETLLRQRRGSLRLAAALARCGGAELAATLWTPQPELADDARQPRRLALVTELAATTPPWLATALDRAPREPELLRLGATLGALDEGRAPQEARAWAELGRLGRRLVGDDGLAQWIADWSEQTLILARATAAGPTPLAPQPLREQVWRAVARVDATPELRATATELLLEEVHLFQRAGRATLILAALNGDARRLPPDDSVRLAREAMACFTDGGRGADDEALGAAGIRFLIGAEGAALPPDILGAVARIPAVWLALARGDSDEAAAVRRLLEAQAEPSNELWMALDCVLCWLPPALAEPLVADVLAALPARRWLGSACHKLLGSETAAVYAGEDEPELSASYRLQRAVLQGPVAGLPVEEREALLSKLTAAEHPRAAWFTAQVCVDDNTLE